ncbi:Polysaccharide deacetylase OS=Bosea thiooxidans OX=53254 GN=SAMN05660750_02526 PE=4 SV=1 [Bosea thiooxidans]|uniref:Polysaccharide deacetylase n=1 Tax=Bosea thiooxidans TaxID=53254 RepID=A0A1T5EHE6_9HYPH|nr:hypothetical protein [Bosea thiooxidans]SKB83239.1 hypothetical protein SAMN05660750_02526 [Bosea thiooxidans]
MARDFTLKAYAGIVDAALAAGYHPVGVGDWLDGFRPCEPVIVLRHDVDRRPEHALAMAHLEASRGILATYYFRTVGSAFNPAIIREIATLGHEIGYHYEDFHLAKYDPAKAHALYLKNLGALREIAPIRSIAMHGSPLAKYSNMELWNHRSFSESGVKDCILSGDWSQFLFFTDTGRSFDARLTNLRDTIGGKRVPGVASSAAVGEHLQTYCPPLVQLSVHPERWSDRLWAWSRQLVVDTAANGVKVGLRILR